MEALPLLMCRARHTCRVRFECRLAVWAQLHTLLSAFPGVITRASVWHVVSVPVFIGGPAVRAFEVWFLPRLVASGALYRVLDTFTWRPFGLACHDFFVQEVRNHPDTEQLQVLFICAWVTVCCTMCLFLELESCNKMTDSGQLVFEL